MQVTIRRVRWPFATLFRTSYETETFADAVQVELSDGNVLGRGEGNCVSYHGETAETMQEQLRAICNQISHGLSRSDLLALLPAGGARNAIDCALWDLEAKRAGIRAWELAGIDAVRPIISDLTLSLDTPQAMAQSAARSKNYSRLKLKLDGNGDIERVASVRAAHPNAQLIVDINQAWNMQKLHDLAPKLADLGVRLIEQPLPAGRDDELATFTSPIPLCADESCQTRDSLPDLIGKYEYINIKLDKTGGLTEGLALAREARARGFKLMVGCMAGSSLAMAPAFIIGQFCDFVDLDGPLLSSADVPHPIRYDGSTMYPPEIVLWG